MKTSCILILLTNSTVELQTLSPVMKFTCVVNRHSAFSLRTWMTWMFQALPIRLKLPILRAPSDLQRGITKIVITWTRNLIYNYHSHICLWSIFRTYKARWHVEGNAAYEFILSLYSWQTAQLRLKEIFRQYLCLQSKRRYSWWRFHLVW